MPSRRGSVLPGQHDRESQPSQQTSDPTLPVNPTRLLPHVKMPGNVFVASRVDARVGGGGICAGQPRDQIHRYFRSATGRIPIRCGTWNGNRGFGVRKLAAKARWNVWYKNMISITLNNPRHVIKEGTTWVYRTRTFKKCNPPYHFRVVVQRAKVGGTKRMRGVITAYQKFS